MASGSNMPALFSNSRKYREQSFPYQSNRSGSATLTTRALLGKDGTTVLEATTGELDNSVAPGSIAKLQVKLFDANGDRISTVNFNGLSGPVQQESFPGLARHGSIQTQANVRDIDPRRTDVVTVTERINLRPDLEVSAISAPEKSKPNTEIIIVADVREVNGDVGARSNCVLYVDGAESKRIEGLWVAENDVVNCTFRTQFGAVGTYTLETRAQDVVPGDWDLANNSASRSIEIVNPEIELQGTAWSEEWDYRDSHRWGAWWQDTQTGYSGRYEGKWGYDSYRVQGAHLYGWSQGGGLVTFPLTSANFEISSGGTSLLVLSGTNLSANSYGCSYTTGDTGYDYLYVCSYSNSSYVQAGHYSGAAVYYNYNFWEHTGPGYSYSYSYGDPSGERWSWGGLLLSLGDEVAFRVRVEGANGNVLTASPIVGFGAWYDYSSWYSHYNQPWTCSTYTYGSYYTSQYCYEREYRYRYRWGSTNF